MARCMTTVRWAISSVGKGSKGKGQKMKAQKGGAVDDDRDELTKTMDMDL